MKISLNWLRELVELPPTVDELVRLLTMAGVEVEGVETRGVAIEKVVVAQINESVQHPNADRLSVCQVDDGSGHPRQIVCGAKNYKVGDKVPVALPGAILPGDFKIKVGKLRGVESQGMLCSSTELGLPKGEDGLLILPVDAKVGAPLSELYPGDTILDLEITPNRPDLLSMRGIAREVATLMGKTWSAPKVALFDKPAFGGQVVVSASACPLYSAWKIENVQVKPSPEWLRSKLETVGLRSINNIVDITNFVMLEVGQPLHAFDASKLNGDLNVRLAAEAEAFLALDGKSYALNGNDLVVADASRAVAIAGVMGGEETGVSEGTTAIWLESAYFEPQSVRRTSRKLGLSSDSSYRFERGVDAAAVIGIAVMRAAGLIAELAGGVVKEMRIGFGEGSAFGFDVQRWNEGWSSAEPAQISYAAKVPLRVERVAHLLGAEISEERVDQILTGFGLKKAEGGEWQIPSFRPDLTREVDLIEEVARVIGMDVIPAKVQAKFSPASEVDSAYDFAMNLCRAFAAQGLSEARNITLVPAQPLGVEALRIDVANLQRVKNPMIDDQVVLRPHLLHGLFTALRENLRAGAESVRLFEIGRVFSMQKPEESSHAAVVLTGATSVANWRKEAQREFDLYDLKGILEKTLGGNVVFDAAENSAVALSLTIKVGSASIGFAGQLWPADARALDAESAVLFAEIDLAALMKATSGQAKKYREIVRFPAVTRDMALLVPLTLAHAAIEGCLKSVNEPLLESVELFDVFTDSSGAKIPADQKSLAYSLTYRANDRTLQANEVEAAHARLKDRLKTELNVSFRE